MDAFVSRKRKRTEESAVCVATAGGDDETTEYKIAILSSLHPDKPQEVLFDYLLAYDGSVEKVTRALTLGASLASSKKRPTIGYQSSLAAYAGHQSARDSEKSLTKKGRTVHLYAPNDIEKHTPCSIIHNFLSASDADLLLKELLKEVPQFQKDRFQLFDRTVESPHTMGFYVDNASDLNEQKANYVYNGNYTPDVYQTTPEMLRISSTVREAVNKEIKRRMEYNGGEKLKFQSPDEWKPNTSFVNCYDGGKENVGYHSDQLTYLGPRAIIGSLSLGVAREFRVRKIVPSDDEGAGDTSGQIAIHLPHNSLLVMHAEMQEEWKHAIAPAQTIDPHPLAANKRLNITYRCFKDYLHPKFTPRCKCNIPCVLRCVQKRKVTRGRYIWMCHGSYSPGQKGCSFFEWAKFDEDGRPHWAEGYKGDANAAIPLQE